MNLSRLNITLLVVAVLGVAFGIYGFLFGGGTETRRTGNLPVASEVTDAPLESKRPGPDRREPPPDVTKGDPQPAAPGQTKPEAAPVPGHGAVVLERGDGVIQGTVADPAGVPMAGVQVSAHEHQEERWPRPSAEEVKKQLERLVRETFRTATGADGKFRIEGVARGERYRLTAESELWGELSRTVTPGEPLYLQFLDLPVTSGTVEDASGRPVSEFAVSWTEDGERWYAKSPDYDGRFTARWEEDHTGFRIEAPGFQPSAVFDASHQGKRDVRVVLAVAPLLDVIVKSPAGEPVPRAEVRIVRARINGIEVKARALGTSELRTDFEGRALFRSLAAGEYELRCSIGRSANATATINLTQDTQAEITLDPGPGLLVRVLDEAGKPVPGRSVYARDASGEWVDSEDVDTGNPGEVRLLGLPAAPLQIQVRAPKYPAHWVEVDLSSGAQSIEVRLKPGGKLKGRITDAGGNGLDGILLKMIPPGGAEKGRMINTHSRESGEYETEPLAVGTWTAELYRDWSGPRLATSTITITEGENTQDFAIESACLLRVEIEIEGGGGGDWIWLWIQADGEEEARQEWLGRDTRERNFTVKEGAYLVSAHNSELASLVREVTVGPGVNTVKLRLAKPNALRFSWIEPGSELSKAGIKAGDVLIEYNGQPVTSKADLNRLVEQAGSLNEADAVVLRGKARVEVKLPKIAFHYWLEPALR